ncbi:MAG: pilus assembly protein TadG-related protein, partial [Pseudomonadota bacterium]|nr:pilus assembly protein TadG-related protein [Pseudomonadota bacterium]
MSRYASTPEPGPPRPDGDAVTGIERFLGASGGSIALKFAFVGPAVFLLAVGGIDLLAVNRSQDRLQTIADGAAAAGAEALEPAGDIASARMRAAAFVGAEMRQWPDAPAYEAK